MIATLSGTVTAILPQSIVLQSNEIGFDLFVASPLSFSQQQKVTLSIYMHWHQDNGPSLYGFNSSLEKSTFLMIISCSGIGPKIGLTILAQFDPAFFLQAVSEGDIATLSSINGIGAKKAEQLAIALKHKVEKLLKQHPQLATSTSLGLWKDLTDTLTSLNYSQSEIKNATEHLKDNGVDTTASFDQILRKALVFLAK